MLRLLLLLSLTLVSACATHSGGSDGPMLPSLQATVQGDSVHFAFQLTNTHAEPILLQYRNGQTFDFEVLQGSTLWRWSEGMMFTQALRDEWLQPGETLHFEAAWLPPAGLSGELVAVGRLTSYSHPVEQRAHFRLP